MKLKDIFYKLNEASVKTQTQTRPAVDVDLSAYERAFNPSRTQNVPDIASKTSTLTSPASKSKTRQSLKGQLSTKGLEQLKTLSASGLKDEISVDDQGYVQTEVTPTTLPAVINKNLSTKTGIQPEWHMVKHLPGYMQTAIRALGRQVFRVYTTVPLEQIQVLSTFTNSTKELRAVGNAVRKMGTDITKGTIDFDKIIPGYSADMAVYRYKGIDVMFVQDEHGQYMYAWPSEDVNGRLALR